MGLYCVLCGNRARIVSYHKFPKDDVLLEQWLSFCQIPESVLSSATRLCSDHFKEDDFIHRLNCVMLKPGVIPSVFSKKKSKRRKLKNQNQRANEQMVQIIPINIQNLPATSISSPSPQSCNAENELKNVFQVSDIKGQRALTSTERSKLWYQKKKLAEKNSSLLEKPDVPNVTVKLENDLDIEVSESQFHSEIQELPVQEQQSDIFSNVCRSCAKQNEDLIPINVITSVGISVIAIFNEIGLTISEDDEFPKKICKVCLDEMTMVYKFYKKILNSKSVFERLLLEKNNSEPVDVTKESDTFYEKKDDDDDDDDNNLELKQIDENDPLYECCFQKMCLICGMKQLQDDDQLLEHQLSQHVPVSNQEDYDIMTCPYCKIEFSVRLWYDKHLEKCLGQSEPNQCIVCKLFVQPNDLDNHLRERHMLEIDGDLFRCVAFESCNYISSSVLMLNEHQMAKHDKSLYVCIDCGSDFIASQKLISHRRTHVKEATWCYKCDLVFTDNKEKQRHSYTTHRKPPNKKVLCQICGMLCFSGNKHNNVHHSTSKNYCCDKCNMKFSTLNYLRQHKIIHNDIKPFNCSECGASFNQQSSLVYHMKQHTGEDLLICSVCTLKFDKASKLTSHMEIHTQAGENPHQCDICQRMFTHAATLRVHLRVHKSDGEATSNKNNL